MIARNPRAELLRVARPDNWVARKQLSPAMRQALMSAAESGVVTASRAGTLRSLIDREICDPTGALTAEAQVFAVQLLPLREQCRLLEIPLSEARGAWSGRPEPAALSRLLAGGGWGFADEGRMLHALIHALVLPRIFTTADGHPDWDYGRIVSYFYIDYAGYPDLHYIDPDLEEKMLQDIALWDRHRFMQAWAVLKDWNNDQRIWPHPASSVSAESALTVLDAVGRERVLAIARAVFGEYVGRRGWPDLMLVDGTGCLQFVEVKTTDTLHYSQILTIPAIRDIAGLSVSVLRLIP